MEKQDHPAASTPPASAGAPVFSEPPKPKAVPVKVYEADGKDRFALFLAWALGALAACVLLAPTLRLPGLGVAVGVCAWYAVLLWYKGLSGFATARNLLLFAATIALAACFALFSDQWLRQVNALGLAGLMIVQLLEWSGEGRRSWYLPTMLLERTWLFFRGLFGRLPACGAAAKSLCSGRSRNRFLLILAGLGVTVPIAMVVVPLLLSADEYFAFLSRRVLNSLIAALGETAVYLFLGLLAAPFLFSLLYALRRPQPLPEQKTQAVPQVDPVVAAVALLSMDLLYALFLAVQFTVLFGGAEYLAGASGVTYAQYARSGFFQLVAVAGINLSLILSALQFTRREGRLWRGVEILCTAMVCMSGAFLVSAAYRMSLYVGAYGLSFKRLLTYWGMGMLAVLFAAALVKIWRPRFRFFPVALVASVAGWLLLNYANPDYLVARYNVDLYLRRDNAVMNFDYLVLDLSYDALGPLEDLPGDLPSGVAEYTLDELVAQRQAQGREDAADWRTWSLSAARAGNGSDD